MIVKVNGQDFDCEDDLFQKVLKYQELCFATINFLDRTVWDYRNEQDPEKILSCLDDYKKTLEKAMFQIKKED